MSVKITAYEINCDGCSTDLGRQHEFVAQSMPTGVVVLSFFGVIHACEGVAEEDIDQAKAQVTWGPWTPDRRRQQAV